MREINTHVHSNGLQTEIFAYTKAFKNSLSIKNKILFELEKIGVDGLTPDEFVLKHGGLINTIRRRFTDLWKEEKIQHHPKLLTRKNFAGNDCIAWVLGKDMNLAQKKLEKKLIKQNPLLEYEIKRILSDSKCWGGEDCSMPNLNYIIRAVEKAHGIGEK